jgi:methylaspartate mutase epsilon subunit
MSKLVIRNERLSDEEFFRIRREQVLPQWKTSKDIENLDENIATAKELSRGKNIAVKFMEAKKNGKHLLIPQFGRALTEYMIDGISYVEQAAKLAPDGFWSIFSDSYTRKNRYEKAAEGIERSRREGMSMLNGWPIVNFGVYEARRILQATQVPLNFNANDEDSRLATEIAYAAGWSGGNAHTLQTVIAHGKDTPLEVEIRLNQYECRLAGIYTERGMPICPTQASNLMGYDSAGYHSFVNVSEAILAAEQGVQYQFIEHGLGMNLIQDVAMINVSERLCYEYTKRLGYKGVEFFTGGFAFLGAWPPREEEADAMIAWNAIIPILGGFPGVILKCRDEAFATPTKEGMAGSVRLARQLLTIMGTQKLPPNEKLRLEEEMIELEVRAVMEKCLDAGDGDMAIGVCKGVEAGWVDTMLTPWRYNHGKVLLVRDAEGAVRYLDPGNIPLPTEVREYHREKIAEREVRGGCKADLRMVREDLQFASILPSPISKTSN